MKNASACILENQQGTPEPGDVTEAMIRRHKSLSREAYTVEKMRALRSIKRGLVILRFCEFMDGQEPRWFHLQSGYEDQRLQTFLRGLYKRWPWNIPTCGWTPGKTLMAVRAQSWAEFEAATGTKLKEPHLRVLKLGNEEAALITRKFVAAHKRVINHLGATEHGNATT